MTGPSFITWRDEGRYVKLRTNKRWAAVIPAGESRWQVVTAGDDHDQTYDRARQFCGIHNHVRIEMIDVFALIEPVTTSGYNDEAQPLGEINE